MASPVRMYDRFSFGLSVAIAFLNMVLASSAFGEVPIVQLTGIPSRQSIIGERYIFPALIENSVISVSHFDSVL